ncbi:TfoX/Sxy family protein [Marinoscillum sp.]|uniref:TfoX/Sxy family protein n=1 Tax=Marinoscillum sp. TaxID=2024838 RepID=UPI003BAD356C
MAYNEDLAERIRQNIPHEDLLHFTEKKMFGGIAFMYDDKMSVGVVKDDLMVRVISDKMKKVMSDPAVREMDFTKRPMKEFIFVSADGYQSDARLVEWISLGIEHARLKAK